jgi:hypothetical protein
MKNSNIIQNNNSQKIVTYVVISFAIGFLISSIAFFVIFCEDCIDVSPGTEKLTIEEKCSEDVRCLRIGNSTDVKRPIFTLIGKEKEEKLLGLVKTPMIQDALKESNQKDSAMSEDIRIQIYRLLEEEWTKSPVITPFMNSIINNTVSHFLKENHVMKSEKFGAVTFGEHILTNIYGANVAVSIKTDNYDQSQDDWWQLMIKDEDGKPFARECEFDSSAGIFSEDMIVKITDNDTGEFIGILNSATPCDVTEESVKRKTIIEPVSLDNITPVGNFKISHLQGLVENPMIQNSLKLSNEKFAKETNESLIQLEENTEWPLPGEAEPTNFQMSITNNNVAKFLKESLILQNSQFGEIEFPELILTNSKGVTIASTERTYNYIHSQDEWWQVASQNDVLIRQCGPDQSINMDSEDIIIKIYDNNEKFIGILNAATPCDVILDKPRAFYGDSN